MQRILTTVRTLELLGILALESPGVKVLVSGDLTTCTTLYEPRINSLGETPHEAIFRVAQQLFKHSCCPPLVKEALDEYVKQSRLLNLPRNPTPSEVKHALRKP